MVNYFYDCYTILNKVYSEKTYLKQAISSTVIEEKNRSLTIKTCYGVLDKDIELSYYISCLTEKNPKLAIRTILKIAMYDLIYLNKHDYAITKNAVELTKKLGKSGASGFVNAFLRKFISAKLPMPKDEIKYLSVKYSYPDFIVKALLSDYGKDRAEKIMSSSNVKTCLSFYDCNGEEYLKKIGCKFEKTPYDNVYFADNFIRNEDYDKGVYTYQALGSVAICDLIGPCDNLLDCCSAPGGKSVRLSYKCKNVVACDIHEHRVNLIKEYAERMHRNNISPLVKDSTVYDEDFFEKFDAVLVDAPCSGSGVINDNPDIKLNREYEDLQSLNNVQIDILKNASKYVKKGGYLYYSTCSVLKRENIGIINKFMSDIIGFELCKIQPKTDCITENNTVQFLPDISGGLGFFVAKLKKL